MYVLLLATEHIRVEMSSDSDGVSVYDLVYELVIMFDLDSRCVFDNNESVFGLLQFQ